MPFDRFNSEEMLVAPTRLAVQLSGIEDIQQIDDPLARQCRYAYEVVIGGGKQQRVEHEALYCWPSTASRQVRLLERNAMGEVADGGRAVPIGYREPNLAAMRSRRMSASPSARNVIPKRAMLVRVA